MSSDDVQLIEAAWDRIERWMADAAPTALASLSPGCDHDQLRALESTLGRPLPAALEASLRRHDGEDINTGVGLVAGLQLHGCGGIASEWHDWTDILDTGEFDDFAADVRPDPAIAGDQWWRRAWVPFVGNDGYNLCIDLDPAPGGRAGQVIVMDHEIGPGPVVARSLADWFSLWADDLEAGVFTEQGGALVPRGGKPPRAVPD